MPLFSEDEIMRFEFDITDVENKAKQVKTLLDDIAKARTEGVDTTDLEKKLSDELALLRETNAATSKASGSTEELAKHKDKLANAVALVGGQFGGLVGQLGTVGELLIQGSRGAIAFGAALGGIAILTKIITDLENQWKAVAEAEREATDAAREYRRENQGSDQAIADVLQRAGVLTQDNLTGAANRRSQLRRAGFSEQQATAVAAQAQIEGLSSDEQRLVAQLAAQGVPFEPGRVRETLQAVRQQSPGAIEAAQRQADALLSTTVGQARASAGERDAGVVPMTPDQLARSRMNPADLARLQELEKAAANPSMFRLDQELFGPYSVEELELQRFLESSGYNQLLQREQMRQTQGVGRAPSFGATPSQQVINIGTINLQPDQSGRSRGPTTSLAEFAGNQRDPIP